MKDCNQCGKCCIHYGNGGLSASPAEIDFWASHRPHIAAYVRDGEIWVDPQSGDQLTRCPWLEQLPTQNKYVCGIYEDRPEDCRHYPVNIEQMVADECEMIEPADLKRPRAAQKKLDRIMADSRPPYR